MGVRHRNVPAATGQEFVVPRRASPAKSPPGG
ncbi:hypothetical protein OJF2_74070 [Aquisphaera giovannonii]|uniref:Uncharacterized protein n=1 Tax=Aquisphaera giovannonii TaxID=406548 RepID=A0A5B9WE30_9BACT|nr:hypothetical protein OJF2_74070 [Aquisphaera giovannonii]